MGRDVVMKEGVRRGVIMKGGVVMSGGEGREKGSGGMVIRGRGKDRGGVGQGCGGW